MNHIPFDHFIKWSLVHFIKMNIESFSPRVFTVSAHLLIGRVYRLPFRLTYATAVPRSVCYHSRQDAKEPPSRSSQKAM